MSLAEREHVLAAAGGGRHIDIDESAVEQRRKRDDCGEGAARMQSLVDCVATLLYIANANIRILYLEKLDNGFPKEIIFRGKQVVNCETGKIYGTTAHSCAFAAPSCTCSSCRT